MKRHSLFSIVVICGALALAACADDEEGPPIDSKVYLDGQPGVEASVDGGGIDGVQPDLAPTEGPLPDTAPIEGPQPDLAPTEGPLPDLAPTEGPLPDTAQPDGPLPDSGAPDATSPDAVVPTSNVMYLTGMSSSSLAPMQIKIDGTSKQAVSGLPTSIDPDYIYIQGRRENAYVSRHIPMPMAHVDTYYRPTHLPGNLGQLYFYSDTSNAGRGFFVVRPNGTVKVLDYVAGSSTSTSTYYYYVGMNQTGTIIAGAVGYNSTTSPAVRLVRTDDLTFTSTGTGVCDITPTTPAIAYIRYYSFTFANNNFYFIARDATNSSLYYMFKAPLDCSAKATQVTLPQVGSGNASTMDFYLTLSQDNKKVGLIAGTGSTNMDVMVIDDTTGTVTNISESPADYQSPGYYHMYYSTSTGPMLDLSATGKYIAYIASTTARYDLYVRPVDKSSAAVLVTSSTNFSSTYDTVAALQWANDDDLFFWVGTSSSYMDLFKYKVSTGAVTQVTTTGGTTPPYTGSPTLRPYGGWFSPNGKYFYFLEYNYTSASTTCNIRAIDLATGTIKDITTNLYVDYGTTNIEAALTGSKVFFFAETTSATNDQNLYVFDQDTASAAVKLTSFSATSYIYDIMPSSDGSLVAFGVGTSSTTQDLYVVQVQTTPVVTKLTSTTGYVSDMKWFTADGLSVVYGQGSSSYMADLRVQPITGGAYVSLESTAAYTSPIMIW